MRAGSRRRFLLSASSRAPSALATGREADPPAQGGAPEAGGGCTALVEMGDGSEALVESRLPLRSSAGDGAPEMASTPSASRASARASKRSPRPIRTCSRAPPRHPRRRASIARARRRRRGRVAAGRRRRLHRPAALQPGSPGLRQLLRVEGVSYGVVRQATGAQGASGAASNPSCSVLGCSTSGAIGTGARLASALLVAVAAVLLGCLALAPEGASAHPARRSPGAVRRRKRRRRGRHAGL
jgi:hypothetical protein